MGMDPSRHEGWASFAGGREKRSLCLELSGGEECRMRWEGSDGQGSES